MDLALTRIDYAQFGNIKNRCMKLLPQINKDPMQKIAVAGKDGIFQVLQFKKDTLLPLFKPIKGPQVNVISLGGQIPKDKIFLCSSNHVRGFKKNGEQFVNFPHESMETPNSMYVEGANLFLTTSYTYHHFIDCAEKEYYLSPDRINDVICLPIQKQPNITPMFACNDNTVKVIYKSSIQGRLNLQSTPLCLSLFNGDGGEEGDEVLVGLANGVLVFSKISRDIQKVLWEIPNCKNHLGISYIYSFDLTGNQIKDIILAHEDNYIAIYSIEDINKPTLIYSMTNNESITSIQAGFVSNTQYPEVIYSTFSGWICSLTTQPPSTIVKLSSGGEKNTSAHAQTIATLNKEISELRRQIEIEQGKVKNEIIADISPTIESVSIVDKIIFNSSDATYVLTIEVDTSMEYILVQSNKVIDILESERNLSVLSYSPCTPQDGNKLLATYRLMANTARMEIKFRSVEDNGGIVNVYIVPRVKPQVCHLKSYHIKPLSLHERTTDESEIIGASKLILHGNFSYSEIHAWLVLTIRDLADRTPLDDIAQIKLINCFVGTRLHITYKKGEAIFISNNVSTIMIIKDAISREATKKGTKVDVSYELNKESLVEMLTNIHPKFEHQTQLAKKVAMIDGLKELQVQDGAAESLSNEFKEILSNSDKLIAEFKLQPNFLVRLQGIVVDLYNDWCKFKGKSAKIKLPELYNILENYNLANLMSFFNESSVD